jgi:hypothetical protein
MKLVGDITPACGPVFATQDLARRALAEYIEVFRNRTRLYRRGLQDSRRRRQQFPTNRDQSRSNQVIATRNPGQSPRGTPLAASQPAKHDHHRAPARSASDTLHAKIDRWIQGKRGELRRRYWQPCILNLVQLALLPECAQPRGPNLEITGCRSSAQLAGSGRGLANSPGPGSPGTRRAVPESALWQGRS